jgi:plastocyanin
MAQQNARAKAADILASTKRIRGRYNVADRHPARFWIRWMMTLGVVVVIGTAAATRAQAEEIVIRPAVLDSNFGEVRIVSTEFKFAPATVRVIAGRSVTLILDNSQGETEHEINVPAFGFYLIARGGQVTRKSFIFDEPGQYEFICELPGHQEAGMKGKLIVRGP